MIKGCQKKSMACLIALVILVMMLLCGGCSTVAQKTTSVSKPEIVVKEGWTEIGKDIFIFTSDFYLANSVLVTSGDEAVLVDTGQNGEDKQKIQSFLDERKLKLKNIIITHMHSDHSANLAALKTEGMEPITPGSIKDTPTIALGDKTLKLILTEGHYRSKEHMSVEIVNNKVLIAGDVICNNILPPIAAGGDIKALLETLKKLEAENYSLIIPGHGEIVDNKTIFIRQFEYLENVMTQVEKVIAAGGKFKDLGEIELEDCIEDTSYLYKEQLDFWHKRSLEAIYSQLKKK